ARIWTRKAAASRAAAHSLRRRWRRVARRRRRWRRIGARRRWRRIGRVVHAGSIALHLVAVGVHALGIGDVVALLRRVGAALRRVGAHCRAAERADAGAGGGATAAAQRSAKAGAQHGADDGAAELRVVGRLGGAGGLVLCEISAIAVLLLEDRERLVGRRHDRDRGAERRLGAAGEDTGRGEDRDAFAKMLHEQRSFIAGRRVAAHWAAA